MIEIKVPTVGESINEVTLIKWLKKDGDYVERDEVIAELESEKATFEINAEQAGLLKTIAAEGDTLKIGEVAATLHTNSPKPSGEVPRAEKKDSEIKETKPKNEIKKETFEKKQSPPPDVKATPVA